MFWLDTTLSHLAQRMDAGTLTHALMLAGRPGVGKRLLAGRVAAQFLALPSYDEGFRALSSIVAPDFHHLAPEEGKRQISVDQVRELGAQFALSSHARAGKVAVIEPANAMTLAAANSLLKTLEEPSGTSLLILIVDDMSRVPATVASRSTVYRIHPPAGDAAAAWLVGEGAGEKDAKEALALATGAPLLAQTLIADGGLDAARQVRADLAAIVAGRLRPMGAALAWKQLALAHVLASLRSVVQTLIYARWLPKMRAASEFGDYVMDTRDLFCYLDAVNRLIAKTPGSYNPELALEALALPWAERLRGQYESQFAAA